MAILHRKNSDIRSAFGKTLFGNTLHTLRLSDAVLIKRTSASLAKFRQIWHATFLPHLMLITYRLPRPYVSKYDPFQILRACPTVT